MKIIVISARCKCKELVSVTIHEDQVIEGYSHDELISEYDEDTGLDNDGKIICELCM